MLSTNARSGIQRRRTQHRRQNSTPAAFEAPRVRPFPANLQQKRQQRSGMSLDLRGLNLETIHMPSYGPIPEQTHPGAMNMQSFQQEDSTVSITNPGQPQQHTMQVAQTHSQPQPGPQDTFLQSPVQTSLPSPRTPRRTLRAQSPQQPPQSPAKAPTEQQLKDLREHIQSVYGSCGQVFINILPTPTATPQKPAQLPSHEPLDTAPMPPNFADMANINLEPTSSAMAFDFENPDADMGYESSSYYTSDALSPSPMSSPTQKSMQPFLEGIEEHPSQEMVFSQQPSFPPATSSAMPMDSFPLSMSPMSGPSLLPDIDVDASLEYTGISPEEVQRYISEQDPTTSKWTCLYPDCGKIFGRRENIRSHVQTHLGDRQYKCNGCGKRFVRQHDLKRHAKIHTGNKPYLCPCGAGFARQDALTRHRQRGMCVGGFPDAVRRQAKRGRPKKNRPEMEQRIEKASRTRRALASAASSVSASSPQSDTRSPSPFEDILHSQPLPKMLPETASFNDPMSSAADPFSFDPASSPFTEDANGTASSFVSSSSYTGDVTSMNILQHLSQNTHTPPMSPADNRPHSAGSASDSKLPAQPNPLKGSSTPSRSSLQSNPFTTPPTSPVEPKDELEELFDSLPESSCSQFDLEMNAMSEFTSLDSSSYDFLDFTV
ncbi:BTE binding protein 4 [Trematosphaeria pertusa]|uniref:BTE binding protein 4 n=1 Tax=Trematosphaeria pertusa TaxID=390896 RepID=A0A6A6I2T5_9PLEO|nr:BTE binding protein 4 [Trematosphaeria pertusa]KAF2244587.1 BTE binding protein 4 [Trematosphaeria pertusa]